MQPNYCFARCLQQAQFYSIALFSGKSSLPLQNAAAERFARVANAQGSKLGCGEGGCGACAVEVTRVDCTTGTTSL